MKLSHLVAIGAVALVIQNAQATLLFSDAFDSYATGNLSGDVNPGNSTAWSTAASGLSVASGSLTYGSLYTDSSGNDLQIQNGTATSSINTYANTTSGQIYYSFLFDPTVADGANSYFIALNPGSTAPGGSADAVDAYSYISGKVEIRGAAQSAQAGTGVALTLGTTYLIVERLDLDAHTASLWINPDSSTFGTLTPPTAIANLSGLTATAVDDVGFKAQTLTGTYNIDDLLIGTTWADVTSVAPTPEPSTMALAGLGMLGLAFARRMRR